jgi:hypothetical protein
LTPPLLTTSEVANLLKLAEITLRKWRLKGAGPHFVRCGSSIRYHPRQLADWVDQQTASSTSNPLAVSKAAGTSR